MNRALVLLALAACTARPGLDDDNPDAAGIGLTLPKGFLFGTATAAHQIEGSRSRDCDGGYENDWTIWESDGGHIRDGGTSATADDSWCHFDKDLATMQSLHVNAYRMSIEWARIEPKEGVWDDDALGQYQSEIRALNAAGIKPMITLLHFTMPVWAYADGGWTNPATADRFATFVAHVVPVLGPDVELWCTVNEANAYVVSTYLLGNFPPGELNANVHMATAFVNLMKAHAKAAKIIHDMDPGAQVGVAHSVRIQQPASSSTLDVAIAGLNDDFYNESVPRANATGHMVLNIPGMFDIDEEIPDMKGSFDYLGINYYTRDTIRGDLTNPALSNMYFPDGRPLNDLGWDEFPDGLYIFLERFKSWGLPIYVTENGVADTAGDKRGRYLAQHMDALERASRDGVDVRGYMHWSLMDNFEWEQGYAAKFGLFSVDFEKDPTSRNWTPAVDVFRTIAGNLKP
jgi:beta-glucosidase